MSSVIQVSNPHANYLAHKEEIDDAIHAVLDGGQYVMGDAVEKFEEEFASYIGVQHVIGVASGTDAIEMILRALGIGPGDEVITVSNTATATVAPIAMVGAKPVFAASNGKSMNMEPLGVERCITPRTKAIMPVHLYGLMCDIEKIAEISEYHGLHLIEDACQAHGARRECGSVAAGGFGIAGAFSFYPTKNLSCLGDGGAIATNNRILADKLRRMRFYDWDSNKDSRSVCGQSRLDAIHAATLRVKLKYLYEENRRRQQIALMYTSSGIGAHKVHSGHSYRACLDRVPGEYATEHVFHQFVVHSGFYAELSEHMRSNGVETGRHYPIPVHKQHAYRQDVLRLGEECDSRGLISLPMHPELSDAEVEHVISSILSFERRAR